MIEHEMERQALLRISRSGMARRHLQSLLDGYRNGELSAEDIYQYTTIEPEQLEALVNG